MYREKGGFLWRRRIWIYFDFKLCIVFFLLLYFISMTKKSQKSQVISIALFELSRTPLVKFSSPALKIFIYFSSTINSSSKSNKYLDYWPIFRKSNVSTTHQCTFFSTYNFLLSYAIYIEHPIVVI